LKLGIRGVGLELGKLKAGNLGPNLTAENKIYLKA
jgi:hypothetical protein